MNQSHYSMKELHERGWSNRLVRIFLGDADTTVPNPYQRTGRPKKLFLASRVKAVESSTEFLREKERSAAYSARLGPAAETKRRTLEALVSELTLPDLGHDLARLMAHVKQLKEKEPRLQILSESGVALDILLDTMKSLDWHLDSFAWHPGVRNARKLLRNRMLAHIIDHYPTLAQAAQERAAQEEGNAGDW